MIFSLTRRSPSLCDIVSCRSWMNLSQAHHVSKRPGGQPLVRGKNLSSPIVFRVTEIVNQPFPSKVHALTGRVTPIWRVLRGSAEVLLPPSRQNRQLPCKWPSGNVLNMNSIGLELIGNVLCPPVTN